MTLSPTIDTNQTTNQNKKRKMNIETTFDIDGLFESVEKAIEDFAIAAMRGDHSRNWHALRIKPDGEIYTSEEASPCYSENEYYKKTPHTLTIHSEHGNHWNPTNDDNPGWGVEENGSLNLNDFVGDRPNADQVCYNWKETLQEWIDAGNYRPIN